jgi:preprotein translocase subunit SecY
MNWRVIWKSMKDSDMRNRVLAVLGMLLVFRVLAHIPIPLSSPETLKQVLETIYTSAKSSSLLSFIVGRWPTSRSC